MEQLQYGEQGGGGTENYDYESQQRAPSSKSYVRPMVDPDAEGEVDPTQ